MLAIVRSAQYKRHRPETTLLYQLVERYYPEFTANLAEQRKYLPKYVEREFDEYLRCGRLEHGFMRVVYSDCNISPTAYSYCPLHCDLHSAVTMCEVVR